MRPRILTPRLLQTHLSCARFSIATQLRHSTSTESPQTSPSSRVDLTNQICIVTGATGAIGFEIARSLAVAGARVTLIARTEQTLRDTADRLRQDIPSGDGGGDGGRISCAVGDVTDGQMWKRLSKESSAVDILVNAAGIAQNSLLWRASEDELKKIVDTNLVGTMLASKHISRNMSRKKSQSETSATSGACIINVGSILGQQGGKGAVAYAASKAGIVGLTRAMADELSGAGIRVNCVQPGYIISTMTEGISKAVLEKIPAGRFGQPSEVADAAMFLISNQYVNGCVLNIDGGLSVRGAW